MAEHHVCPVWIGYFLASPLRRIVQNPEKILAPYILPAMTVMDVGCAMGFFSLPMAEMVGPKGRVVCVDLQKKMLDSLEKKARKVGLAQRIESRLCSDNSLEIDDLANQVDFALAFAVGHEVAQISRLFEEIRTALKKGALLLFAEPKNHVHRDQFDRSARAAQEAGFETTAGPRVARSRTAIFRKR